MNWTMDLSGLAPASRRAVLAGLQHEDRARHALGVIEQAKLKKFHDAMAIPGVLNNGMGRQVMIRSADQNERFKAKYGQLCWADPDFSKWVLKKTEHADLRVKDVGEKIQVGYTGKAVSGWVGKPVSGQGLAKSGPTYRPTGLPTYVSPLPTHVSPAR